MKRSRIPLVLSAALLSAAPLVLAASQTQTAPARGSSTGAAAIARIEPRSGSTVKGEATFTEKKGLVTMMLSVEGADPGLHAVHLHEKGDCSAPDATSAGGHWNPAAVDHGKWGKPPFHHGDIGNLKVGSNGKGKLKLTTTLWSIGGDPKTDILGKALIVHAQVDDFTTQPTGNAGGRVGCGVVVSR